MPDDVTVNIVDLGSALVSKGTHLVPRHINVIESASSKQQIDRLLSRLSLSYLGPNLHNRVFWALQ